MNLVGFIEPGVVCPFQALSAARERVKKTASVSKTNKERMTILEEVCVCEGEVEERCKLLNLGLPEAREKVDLGNHRCQLRPSDLNNFVP